MKYLFHKRCKLRFILGHNKIKKESQDTNKWREEPSIPVFLASDENYAPFLCTVLYSIILNTSSYINFYILDGGIKEKTKNLILKSLRKFQNFSIKYIDMTNFKLERFPKIKHYSVNAFSRYFIPQFALNLEKAIYFDVDIIVRGDISKLYNIDLKDKALAVVSENFYRHNGEYLKEHLKPDFQNSLNYFNTGVMVLNNKQFIENNYSDQLINLTLELYDKLACADQDVFNIVFEHNHKLVDYKFNYMPDFKNLYNDMSPGLGDKLEKEAIILHYTARKPWKDKEAELSNEFWEIAQKTSFKKSIAKIYKDNKSTQKTLLKNAFSMKYQNEHIVWTIFGIKFKFRNKQKGF